MAHILVSAAHKSSGKTTVSIGLCSGLARTGLKVQPFKKGPDYIDPLWLSRAAGQSCYNLDFYTMSREEILGLFRARALGADIAVVEGNKGLYDGLDLDGSNSNAALASALQAPVVLVIDARGMTRGIAPLILGYQAFDPDINIAGVILNRLGGSRHEGKLRSVIEHYTDVPVLGAVHVHPDLEIVERHLGLVPSNEHGSAQQQIERIGDLVCEQVDLDRVMATARSASLPDAMEQEVAVVTGPRPSLRVGVAIDDAFGFYYPDDLEALEAAGASIVPFRPTEDPALPNVDALFIGGGFPESRMVELEANVSLRAQLRDAIENGLPVYAECGGLMYLTEAIEWEGQSAGMVGVIPGRAVMEKRPQGRGYVKLRVSPAHPWGEGGGQEPAAVIAAHEFHYSRVVGLPKDATYAYEVERGTGIDGQSDGWVYKNLLASYVHLRNVEAFPWAEHFVRYVERLKHKGRTNDQINTGCG